MRKKIYTYSIGVAYGGLTSPRWVFTISGNDVYISSETINQDIKLSIHESGQCHIKIEYETLRRFKDSPTNQDTYIEKWFLSNIKGALCQSVCRIVIPVSSLYSGDFTKTPDHVISLSDTNKTITLHCFITSPRLVGEIIETTSTIVYQKQLSNLKCFVVTYIESGSYIEAEKDMQENITNDLKKSGMWDTLPDKMYGVTTFYNKDEDLYSLVQYRLNK